MRFMNVVTLEIHCLRDRIRAAARRSRASLVAKLRVLLPITTRTPGMSMRFDPVSSVHMPLNNGKQALLRFAWPTNWKTCWITAWLIAGKADVTRRSIWTLPLLPPIASNCPGRSGKAILPSSRFRAFLARIKNSKTQLRNN